MAAKTEIPNGQILDMLTEAIEALVQADAPRLTGLTAGAGEVAAPAGERARREAVRLYRAFGRLLVLTRRNLRLLGAAQGAADGYGTGRD